MERRLHFNGIQNARELGGMINTRGQHIRSGCLLRSAHLGRAQCDAEQLKALRLVKIVDLRTGAEREEQPDFVAEDIEHVSLPIFDESVLGISHEKKNRGAAHLPVMEELYTMILTEEACRRNLGQAAAVVMEHDYSRGCVLWHCTEGKDRCGLLTMTLLMALGVRRGDITEDYLLTNEVNAPKAERYYAGAIAAGKSEAEAEAVRSIFLAKESYLNAAYAVVDQYGSVETFLKEGLFIPESSLRRFRAAILI